MEFCELRKTERGGKEILKENSHFNVKTGINDILLGDNVTRITLFDTSTSAGEASLVEPKDALYKDKYLQLRVIRVEPEYQGGNAVIMLYEKSIEYAESFSKELLFDSSLTKGAYNSFKKLEQHGYSVIENPESKFDGSTYKAPGSWVLRVERK